MMVLPYPFILPAKITFPSWLATIGVPFAVAMSRPVCGFPSRQPKGDVSSPRTGQTNPSRDGSAEVGEVFDPEDDARTRTTPDEVAFREAVAGPAVAFREAVAGPAVGFREAGAGPALGGLPADGGFEVDGETRGREGRGLATTRLNTEEGAGFPAPCSALEGIYRICPGLRPDFASFGFHFLRLATDTRRWALTARNVSPLLTV